MSYPTPDGFKRVWTYFPERVLRDLRLLAVENRHSLAREMQLAVEQYLQREAAHVPRVPTPKEHTHE